MHRIRPAAERGHASTSWLESQHSFSFGTYHSLEHMGFGTLRVLNEDRVAPGAGFDTHSHQDMEIISVVLEGTMTHKDSAGHTATMQQGDVQRMSAGTGITHSEFNASDTDPLHFLQIWISPSQSGLAPGYQQLSTRNQPRNQWTLIASADGRVDSLTIHQDTDIYFARLNSGVSLQHHIASGRLGWLQVARGDVQANSSLLRQGDGLALMDTPELTLLGSTNAEVLLFDMPPAP